jgi:hypothetical protein
MNGLIARIESNDPDMETLFLTSECETVEDMDAFCDAVQNYNTVINKVVYRESFFPLRRLRMHLNHEDFITFLHIVSDIRGLQGLEIPRSMPGMVTGRHVVHLLEHTTTLQSFNAECAITFISRTHDVQHLADKFMQNSDHLKVINLDESHFMIKRRRKQHSDTLTSVTNDLAALDLPRLMDPIFNCSLPHLEKFYLSSGTAPPSSSYKQESLVSSKALHTLLLGDTGLRRCCLQRLSLNRLGLDDTHIIVIAEFLRMVESCVLERLEIHDNHSITHVGNRTLLESLKCNSSLHIVGTTRPKTPTAATKASIMAGIATKISTTTAPIMPLSMTGRSHSRHDTISWKEVFENNFTLTSLSYKSLYRYQDIVDDEVEYDDDHDDDDGINNDDEELQFWLYLNRMGRRQWWRDHAPTLSKEDWVYVLEDVTLLSANSSTTTIKKVSSILYYLVRNYPTKLE